MYSSSNFGTHHIFPPPRFDAAIVEVLPDGNGGYAHQFLVVTQLLLEPLECPRIVSRGRRRTGDRDKVRFHFLGDFRGLPGAGCVVERTVESAFVETFAYRLHCTPINVESVCDFVFAHGPLREEKDAGTYHNMRFVPPLCGDILQLGNLSLRESDGAFVWLHIPQAYHPELGR